MAAPCPLDTGMNPLEEARAFYGRTTGLGGLTSRRIRPGEELIALSADEGRECACYAGAIWRHADTWNANWNSGPWDTSEIASRGNRPSLHFHTTRLLGPIEVHIDYLGSRHWGPLGGINELRVYANGLLAGRGGEFVVVPAALRRNWPLAVELGQQLLVLRKFPTHEAGESSKARTCAIEVWEHVVLESLGR